jgi:hypothetical protein
MRYVMGQGPVDSESGSPLTARQGEFKFEPPWKVMLQVGAGFQC